MEEKADRLKVEHESVSAQLQVVYEHKSRLEKTVQEERTLHKKTKDELNGEKENLEQRMRQEKETLAQELDRIKSERDRFEDESNKAGVEKQHEEEELKNLQDSCDKQNELHQQQINQQRQECDNDVAQLKDEIADLRRRNGDLEAKVKNQSQLLKPGSIDYEKASRNKSLIREEAQNVMQIAEPGDNKPKAYFEVKSPAPVDKKLAEAQMQQQDQKEQVAPPVVKDPETDDNDKHNADVDANQVQNDDDNRIKDIPAVTKSRDRNLGVVRSIDKNVIDRIPGDTAVKEPPREERNVVPGQVPPPASKDENQPAGGNEIPNQVDKPHDNVQPGQVMKPGQVIQPGQVNPPGEVVNPPGNDRHVAKIPDEDDIEEEEQAANEGQQGKPDAKKNADNEQEEEYEENQDNNAKDM